MKNPASRRGPGVDDGFTLVELLLAIIIIGVITVPLASVVIGYLKNTDATTARLLASHDVQITSAYWAQDVASIGTRSTTDILSQSVTLGSDAWTDSNAFLCGADQKQPIVRLAWDDFTVDPTTNVSTKTPIQVTYLVQASTELHRLRCEGSATVASDVTLAHSLSSTLPTVSCLPTTTPACVPAPKTVTLTLTLTDPGSKTGVYSVPFTGQRRQS